MTTSSAQNNFLPLVKKRNNSLVRKISLDLNEDTNSQLHTNSQLRHSFLSDLSKTSQKAKAFRVLNLSNDVLQIEPDHKISSPIIKHLRKKPKAFTSKPNIETSKSLVADSRFSIPDSPMTSGLYSMLSPKQSPKSKTVFIQPYSPTADAKTNGTSSLGLFPSPTIDQRRFSIPSLSQINDTEPAESPLHRNKATTQQRINMRSSLKYYTSFEEINPGQNFKTCQLSGSKHTIGGSKTTQITSELKGKIASLMKEYKSVQKTPFKSDLKIWYRVGDFRGATAQGGSKMPLNTRLSPKYGQ